MKRFLTLVLIVLAVFCALSGCSCDNGEEYNLVFVNDSDTAIVEVVTDSVGQSSGTRNADNSPLKRGETFGFEVQGYPVTVLVYDTAVGRVAGGELARIVIAEAPPEGERWFVTAHGGGNGLRLTVDTVWPEGA